MSEPAEESINSDDTPSQISAQPSEELAIDKSVNRQIAKDQFGAKPSTSREKQLKGPDELASIIMERLRAIKDCPDRGLAVTVYGSNPWNAMLTIQTDAGIPDDGPRRIADGPPFPLDCRPLTRMNLACGTAS